MKWLVVSILLGCVLAAPVWADETPLRLNEMRRIELQNDLLGARIDGTTARLRAGGIDAGHAVQAWLDLQSACSQWLTRARTLPGTAYADVQASLVAVLEAQTRRLQELVAAGRLEQKSGVSAARPLWSKEVATYERYNTLLGDYWRKYAARFNAIPDGSVLQRFPDANVQVELVSWHGAVENERGVFGQLVVRKSAAILFKGPGAETKAPSNLYFGPEAAELDLVGPILTPGKLELLTESSERGGHGPFEVLQWDGKSFISLKKGYLAESGPGQYLWKLPDSGRMDVHIERFVDRSADGTFSVLTENAEGKMGYATVRATASGFERVNDH